MKNNQQRRTTTLDELGPEELYRRGKDVVSGSELSVGETIVIDGFPYDIVAKPNYDGKTRGQVITDFDNNQELRDRISVNQAEALDSFIEATGLTQTVARGIDKAVNDNLGWDPDAINWAHVGTINHINDLLDQVQNAIESATGSTEWFATKVTGSY